MGQIVEIPLVGGLAENVESSKVQGGQLIRAENARIYKDGSYGKRLGMNAVPSTLTGGTQVDAQRVIASSSSLVSVGTDNVYSYVRDLSIWQNVDEVPPVVASAMDVASTPDRMKNPDGAHSQTSNNLCFIWCQGDGTDSEIWTCIVALDGTEILAPTQLSTAGHTPHVMWLSGVDLYIATWRTSLGLNAAYITAAAPSTWTTSLAIIPVSYLGRDPYDWTCNTNAVFVAYNNNVAAGNPSRTTIAAFGSGLSPVPLWTLTPTDAVTINANAYGFQWDSNSNVFHLGYAYAANASNTVVRVARVYANATLQAIGNVATIVNAGPIVSVGICGTGAISSQTSHVWWCVVQGSTMPTTQAVRVTSAAAADGQIRTLFGATLCSKPFVYQGRSQALIGLSRAADQASLYLMDGQAGSTIAANLAMRPICAVATRTTQYATGLAGRRYESTTLPHLSLSWTYSNGVPGVVETRGTGDNLSQYTFGMHTVVVRLQFEPHALSRQFVDAGGLTYLTGGVPSWFDSSRVGECAFLEWPVAGTDGSGTLTAVNATGGSLTASSTYGYAAVYYAYDTRGVLHESAPYFPTSVSTGAMNAVNVNVHYDHFTTRQDLNKSPVRTVAVALYRTAANGTVYRQLTQDAAAASGDAASNVGTIQNNQNVHAFTYTDIVSDSSIASNKVLYTQSGELENVNPPSARFVVSHRGRVFYAGCPDGKEIWASKLIVQGLAPGFSEGLVLRVDDGGDITGLASLDDKLVVFKRTGVYYVTGDGPDNTGGGSTWSDPVKIVGALGCPDGRGLVVFTGGILYRSDVGLSVLTRGLECVTNFGAAVEDTLASYPYVTAATLVAAQNEIRLVCWDGGTGTRELRYDYSRGTWFVTSYGMNLYGGYISGACLDPYNGRYTVTSNTGNVFQESNSTYLDANTFVATTLDLAPIATGGTQGYQSVSHVMVSGVQAGNCNVTINVAVNGNTFSQGATWTNAQLAALSRIQLDYHPTQTKNGVLRVRLSDASSGGSDGTGEGFRWTGVALEVVPMPGRQKNIESGAKG